MPINVNINNQNKHWILVILEKIGLALKNILYSICRAPIICIKAIGAFFRKIWKGLAIVTASAIVLLIIAVVGVQGYDYHIWNKAVSATETMFETQEDVSAKISLARRIHRKDYFADVEGLWGNEFWYDFNIYYYDIQERIEALQISAFKFVEKLSYDGNAEAQCTLGLIYHWVKNDYEKAAYWYNEAVKQNYIYAYNNLAMAYKKGRGVKQDERKAIEYLRKGAEGGHDFAQRNYGDLFMDGVEVKVGSHKEKKVTSDYREDRIRTYWDYERDQQMYVYFEEVDDFEVLVPKDIEKAKYWWKKAAAQGNEVAKERLQKIYE